MNIVDLYPRLGALNAAVNSRALLVLMRTDTQQPAWTAAPARACAISLGIRTETTVRAANWAFNREVKGLLSELRDPEAVYEHSRDLGDLSVADVEAIIGTGCNVRQWYPSSQEWGGLHGLCAEARIRLRRAQEAGYHLGQLIAARRYDEGDYTATLGERRFLEVAKLAMPLLGSYWNDVLMYDRNEIIPAIDAGESVIVGVKGCGCGTWSARTVESLPTPELPYKAVFKVSPAGVRSIEVPAAARRVA